MTPRTTGYSGTPLPRKLGIKDGHSVILVREPEGFRRVLGSLPPGVTIRAGFRSKGQADVVVLFARSRMDMEKQLDMARARMKPNTSLWIAWPKSGSGLETDLSRESVREIGLAAGLVDIKVCAIDTTWSGLRFVIPRKLRNG